MRNMSRYRLLLCMAILIGLAASVLATDWTQFRGPGGLGIADDKTLPTKWDTQTDIAWKTPLEGRGSSSPIIAGDRIFLTSYTGYGLDEKAPGSQSDLVTHLLCLNRADGKIAWDKTVKTEAKMPGYNGPLMLHGYASATPVADKDTVYTVLTNGEVTAWAFDGSQKWTKNLAFRLHGWGGGASPVLAGDLVIATESVGGGVIVALNKKDGSEAWRQTGIDMAWDTPLLIKVGDHEELIVSGKNSIKAFDPAKGTPLWNCTGIDDYICSSVVAADGVIYAVGARAKWAMAVKAGGKGDVTGTNVLWRLNKGSNVTSPVFTDGHLYWSDEQNGHVYCVEGKTGNLVYDSALEPKPALIYASPILAGGNLYYTDRNGVTYVVAAKPEFSIVSVNKLEGENGTFNASPVPSNGQLLIRSDKFLYCIGKK